MKIDDRYASAVRSSNLRSRLETTMSDTDVLGAAGLAAQQHPLAISLARLFAGDNTAAREIVDLLADWAWKRARGKNERLRRDESVSVARAVFAWHRDGVCTACNGLGWEVVPGAPRLSSNECWVCSGSGKRPFIAEFSPEHRHTARLLLALLDRELGRAGPAAMAKLAPRLNL